MSDNAQAQFVQTLQDIVSRARSNKDTIGMDEISSAFEGMDLPVEQMEEIYEHIRSQNIIVTQGKGPEESIDGEEVPEESDDDILIDVDADEDDLLDSDEEDLENLDDVDINTFNAAVNALKDAASNFQKIDVESLNTVAKALGDATEKLQGAVEKASGLMTIFR